MNTLVGNTYRIDTAGPTVLGGESLIIETVRWKSLLASPGDEVVITNADGDVIWETVADAANYVERDSVRNFSLGGFIVATMDSGVLYIKINRDWEDRPSWL